MTIAFDSISFGAVENGTSFSFNHTCTGYDRAILVCVSGEAITGVSVTYNSIFLAQLVIESTAGESRIWGLVAPASGVNSVAVNFDDTKYVRAHAISYTGVSQSGLLDATQNNVGSGSSPLTSTITTSANNAWAVIYASQYGGIALVPSTNITQRDADDRDYLIVGDNNADITPAGALAQTVTFASGELCRLVQVSLAPAPTGGFLPLL